MNDKIDNENPISDYRSLEIHYCALMVAEPARDLIPEWDGQANTGAFRGICADLHPHSKERRIAIGSKPLQQFLKGSPQREIGLELLKANVLQLEDNQLLKLFRLRFGKDLQQDVSEHYKRFFHRSACLYQRSMQHCVAEESKLHERALQAVRSVSNTSESETGETATKEIIADVLRGFLRLESAALAGSEQVFVSGVACKSYAYNHIANALRETCGSGDRLRSLTQSLQIGHIVGGAHWTGEENERQETDFACEKSVDPWYGGSESYDTEGYDDESYPEETHWSENFNETVEYGTTDSTFFRTHSCTVGPTCRNT